MLLWLVVELSVEIPLQDMGWAGQSVDLTLTLTLT